MNLAVDPPIKEMPIAPAPGEIWLFIDLHAVTNMTTAEVFKLAESLGFPVKEVRYRIRDNGKPDVYAILHQEQRDPEGVLEWDYVCDRAFEELWHTLQPEGTVHFMYKLKGGREEEPESAIA